MRKLIVFALVVIFGATGCSNDDTAEVKTVSLSQTEIDDLKFSREEEKLARDVYLFSYDKYGVSIFDNIAKSELQHMDQVLVLLNTYQISDPASSVRGVFSNQALQDLYNNLIAQSDISLLEAYKVGALIEDLDINDLDDLQSRTSKTDLLNVYDKLECGSRNHLRNYTNQLTLNGFSYEPQYISFNKFIDIVSSSNEKCGK